MALAPRGDAADDEELLAGLHETELTRLTHELRVGARLRDPLLEPRLLLAQDLHLGVPRLQLLLGVQVRVGGLPVEERDEREPAEREHPCWPQADHTGSFRDGSAKPYAGRTATMQAISGVTRSSTASTRGSSSSASRVASPSTGRPGVRSSLIRIPPGASKSTACS